MGKSGGFAYLAVYALLAIFVGFIVMASELAMGRKTGQGAMGTYHALTKKFRWIGWLALFSPFAVMVDQQNADVILVRQCFQRADLLVITGIHTVVLIAGTNLLQGVDDDQPGVRVLIEEAGELFFQPLPDAVAFRLHNQPFGCFFAAHKLEKALLQAVEGVLQR